MLDTKVVIMKVIKRSRERVETASNKVGKEVLMEMVHANVLAPLEIIDDASNDNVYLICPYMRAGSLEERLEDVAKERTQPLDQE